MGRRPSNRTPTYIFALTGCWSGGSLDKLNGHVSVRDSWETGLCDPKQDEGSDRHHLRLTEGDFNDATDNVTPLSLCNLCKSTRLHQEVDMSYGVLSILCYPKISLDISGSVNVKGDDDAGGKSKTNRKTEAIEAQVDKKHKSRW